MIPIVDCKKNILMQKDAIFEALTNVGFVFLINHGIDENLIEKVFETAKNFFTLPLDLKQKFARSTEKTKNSGYVGVGVETLNKSKKSVELREAFNVSPTDGSKVVYPSDLIPQMGPLTQQLMEGLHLKTMEILQALAEKLHFDTDWFLQQHVIDDRPNYTTLRLLYYPSVPDEIPTGAERCGDHADYGTITLLFQDEVGGLEVMNRSGEFVVVKPIKNAILLNTGELLEKWSGGIIKATRHRVRAPADSALRKQIRQSIAYFVHPLNETLVQPLVGDVDRYSPVGAGEFTVRLLSKTY